MSKPQPAYLARNLAIWFTLIACSRSVPQPPQSVSSPPTSVGAPKSPEPTFRGTARYEDGTPAGNALIAITDLASRKEVAVAAADGDGRFEVRLDPGEYALAVTTERGFGWVEKIQAPDLEVMVTLSRTCRSVRGHAKGAGAGTQITLTRISKSTGDVFIGNVSEDGAFALCLPEGQYRVVLRGAVVSLVAGLSLAGDAAETTTFEIEGFAADRIKQAPQMTEHVPADLDGLVAEIVRRDARVIGLGEATHGTAELVSSRGTLTFELIRRADLRLVLFEFDAVLATALDDYVMGGDVDLQKAVAALGFWITDTYEFLRFFEDLRNHNATARNKVRVWGVDVQKTQPAVSLLLANARALRLTAEEKSMLEVVGERRALPVLEFSPARRAALDALLVRLSKPRGKTDKELRLAVAARSLVVQVGYLDGDIAGLAGARRDAGMAALASFLVSVTGVPRACIWAHSAHIAREIEVAAPSMGKHLGSVVANRYYPVGFYVYEGSVRAWDLAGAIGVTSHPIPRAPDYTIEGAVMAAARSPNIAWLPISGFSPALRTWMTLPRFVREVGSAYRDEATMMTLRNIPAAFEALVVIKIGRDSSPTPTGVRKVEK